MKIFLKLRHLGVLSSNVKSVRSETWHYHLRGKWVGLNAMIGENRQLVTDEPIEFEK